ncbi:winged helix-turn-helix transcriptional regulator, partial [Candidatus Parcubacteria bacterium]|nr:winged helix-turn-helix transcriptional regulator [Candidatus Parcubacteria bacterium]
VGERVGERVTENQKKIIQFIIKNRHISATELSVLVGISSRKIEENIAKLKQKNLLKRIGSAKGGYWKIVG